MPVAHLKRSPKLMNKRNHLIDLLRFLAASWVALMHFNQVVPHINNWYRNLLSYGYLGVPVFFVISGYCVYLAAENSKNAGDFIIRRLFRIFPPYWFSILIVGVAVIFSRIVYGGNLVTALPKTVPGVLATITLLTVPLTKIQVINWVYWTLTFEIFFYLVICMALLFSVRYRSGWLILIAVLPLVLPIQNYWFFFFIKHWPEFCLGVIVFRLLHYPKKEVWQNIVLIILTMVGLFTIPLMPYIPLATIITSLLIVLNHFKPLKNNFFSKLGDYSYSIYLIHVPIGVYILGSLKQTQYVQTHLWLNILWDVILLGIIVLLSKIMYLYIELPAIQMGKKYSQKHTAAINPD